MIPQKWSDRRGMLKDSFRNRYEAVPMTVFVQQDRKYADTISHHHMEFEMTLLTAGNARVLINDRIVEASAGDLILINPMEIHRFEVGEGCSCSLICCCFECEMIQKERVAEELKAEKLHMTNLIRAQEDGAQGLKELFGKLIEVYRADGPYVDMEATAYLSLLFAGLLTYGFAEQKDQKERSDRFGSKMLQYIGEHFREQITSKDAAEFCSYDQSYFCRTFKKHFGMNFSEYLNRYRVYRSREYLEEGKQTIAEIAECCGFRTTGHYSECFRESLGILPSGYKRSVAPRREHGRKDMLK